MTQPGTVVRVVHPAPSEGGPVRSTMSMKVEGDEPISLVTTPPTVTGGVGAWRISDMERPGRKPVSQAVAPGLRTLSFEHRVAALDPNVSVEALLEPFRVAVESGRRVQFFDGGMWVTGTWWWVQSLEVKEDLKTRVNATSRATVTWECVEATSVSKVELTKGDLAPRVDDNELSAPPSNPIDRQIWEARNRDGGGG